MENRMNAVNVRQQAKHLPQSITDEISQAKESLHENGVYVSKSTYEQTRDVIVEKLGGELDLSELQAELGSFMDEARESYAGFVRGKLEVPPPAPASDKTAFRYDYSDPEPLRTESSGELPAIAPESGTL